jgi:hypothetical protein
VSNLDTENQAALALLELGVKVGILKRVSPKTMVVEKGICFGLGESPDGKGLMVLIFDVEKLIDDNNQQPVEDISDEIDDNLFLFVPEDE